LQRGARAKRYARLPGVDDPDIDAALAYAADDKISESEDSERIVGLFFHNQVVTGCVVTGTIAKVPLLAGRGSLP